MSKDVFKQELWAQAIQNELDVLTGLFTHSDYSYTGEIKLDKDLNWFCPSCGNRDENEMQVMRRTCGYIGTNFWNKGRTAEIGDRVLHL